MQTTETQELSHANTDGMPHLPPDVREKVADGVVPKDDKKPPQARKLKTPVDWEIPRKTLHTSIGSSIFLRSRRTFDCGGRNADFDLLSGFLTLYLYSRDAEPRDIVLLLSMALGIIVPADILRLRSQRFERFYEGCLGFLMRESEKVCLDL